MTYYERVEPGKAEMIARGRPPRPSTRSHLSTICRRTLGVRLKLPLDMPNGTGSQRLRLRARSRLTS